MNQQEPEYRCPKCFGRDIAHEGTDLVDVMGHCLSCGFIQEAWMFDDDCPAGYLDATLEEEVHGTPSLAA